MRLLSRRLLSNVRVCLEIPFTIHLSNASKVQCVRDRGLHTTASLITVRNAEQSKYNRILVKLKNYKSTIRYQLNLLTFFFNQSSLWSCFYLLDLDSAFLSCISPSAASTSSPQRHVHTKTRGISWKANTYQWYPVVAPIVFWG